MEYEYRAVPAPRQVKRLKGASTDQAFAATLTEAINVEARLGWEYLGSETLAAEETRGWLRRRSVVVEETVLVFRRPRVPVAPRLGASAPREAAEAETAPAAAPAPQAEVRTPPLGALRGERRAEPRAAPARPAAAESAEAAPTLLRPVPR